LDKPSLNLATEARGSTSQLGEACKPARRLDVILKIAMTFLKIVRIHSFEQEFDKEYHNKVV
jgi:hypothetical protein